MVVNWRLLVFPVVVYQLLVPLLLILIILYINSYYFLICTLFKYIFRYLSKGSISNKILMELLTWVAHEQIYCIPTTQEDSSPLAPILLGVSTDFDTTNHGLFPQHARIGERRILCCSGSLSRTGSSRRKNGRNWPRPWHSALG